LFSVGVTDFPRQAMIDEFDLDGDGEISLKEFLAIMMDGQ
jgi:Ca2+-binding EF-hand superfamily protein